ncbi:MAG: penicillin-binding transpeptidase domain-containing protein [Pseudomonadota bacterium]
MANWFTTRRRRRNLQKSRNGPPPLMALGCAALVLVGATLIAFHARRLVASTINSVHSDGNIYAANEYSSILPGAVFNVPAAGAALQQVHGGSVLALAGMQGEPPIHVDLCSHLLDPASTRLLPLRIGFHFDDVAQAISRHETPLRNVALAAADDTAMPRVLVQGDLRAPLQVAWSARSAPVRWVSDAGAAVDGKATLGRENWLIWGADNALRLQRRASASCPKAGVLQVQLFRRAAQAGPKALVLAFPEHGAAVSSWLAPGAWQVPAQGGPVLEDEALFGQLIERAMLRLDAGGQAELAPRDLALWRAAPAGARAVDLSSWDNVVLDLPAQKLLKHLYWMADGEFVRQQVAVFNGERRLLAVRTRPGSGEWLGAAAAPAATAQFFADLPQGWAPWARVDGAAHLQLAAAGKVDVMLAGRLRRVEGARVLARQDSCTGRACPDAAMVQVIRLEPLAGAREIVIVADPVPVPIDQQYRFLRVEQGKLAWHQVPQAVRSPALAGAPVTLSDRNGTVLWNGAPSAAAQAAGLATMLGLRADQANSIAGMLARTGGPHNARLSLDLPLQALSQRALDCVGMRRGQWDGAACKGGQAAPEGRHAGLVIIDTETGDILAAAGAGTAAASLANWSEVRDFDRANPARSPLRLPAWQHDGGIHNSPGSTFKIISALGLEMAARRDAQIDAMLAGLPLAALNRMAHERGFAFQTDAAAYPANTRLAHISNYKDQHLDRRAVDGRLGLPQALTYSLNTWFAWSGELADRSLFGQAEGGAPDLQALGAGALDTVRPSIGMAHRLGFEQALRLDGGLLGPAYAWQSWDALQASAAHIDPIHTRHELRQMAIGLRMQATPLQMALAAGAVGQGSIVAPRLLLELDGRQAQETKGTALGVRLDRIRSGLKGVVDAGTAAGAFGAPALASVRHALSGKTGTSPSIDDLSTVWFTGWLEPGALPGQAHRLAVAAFVSHSEASGGEHAAPIVAAILRSLLVQSAEQKGK